MPLPVCGSPVFNFTHMTVFQVLGLPAANGEDVCVELGESQWS